MPARHSLQDAGQAGAPSVWVGPPGFIYACPSPSISPPMSQEQERGSYPSRTGNRFAEKELETMAKLTKQQRKAHAEAEASQAIEHPS